MKHSVRPLNRKRRGTLNHVVTSNESTFSSGIFHPLRANQYGTPRPAPPHLLIPSFYSGRLGVLLRTHLLPSPEEEFPLPSGNRPPASPAPLCELGLAIGYIWDSYLVSVVMVMF